VKTFFVALVLLALARVATAYPQFQLSKDQTCTACHISPAGGLLLNENGLSVAETMSTYGGAPEALHGKLGTPSWLQLGGDLRGGAGLVWVRGAQPGAFPMQGDLDAAVHGSHNLTFVGTFGFQRGSSPQTFIASREHWLMWEPDDGLYLRIGRFMPVYGLRFAEHTAYTRRYGQTPLYGETYGAAVAYVDPAWEVHVTGFVHDPLQDSTEHGDGAAGYGEVRIAKIASVGLEGRYAHSDEDSRLAGGATAKLWLEAASVLLEGEVQGIRQRFAAGGQRDQIVSYLLATWFPRDAWMLDVGVGQYNEDLSVKNIELECIDVNLHWFATSHWELLQTNRIQTIAFGAGGKPSGYALLQFHYRI
jgi:hypothetical protein